jgi:hypothetical protein
MNAQEIKIKSQSLLNKAKLESLWKEFSKDDGWRALTAEMTRLGYKRGLDVKQMWGVKGITSDGQPLLLCMYDFTSSTKKPGTMVWLKKGTKVYKAYIRLGKGKDIDAQIENSVEYYANANGKLVKASSFGRNFGRCFRNRLRDQCGTICLGSLGACALTFSLVGYVHCVVFVCGGCATVAAISCGFL